MLSGGKSLEEALAASFKSKSIRLSKKHGSVNVRICDGRREADLPKKKVFIVNLINTRHIQYDYNFF